MTKYLQLKSNIGFTLVELMVTIAITAIIAAIAAPSFSDLIKNNTVAAQGDELYAQIMLARSEAIKRSKTIVICTSRSGTACDETTSTTSKSWSGNLLAFAKPNSGFDVTSASGLTDNDYLFMNTLNDALSFTFSKGRTLEITSNGTASNSGNFIICDSQNDVSSAVKLELIGTGRPLIADLNEGEACGVKQ